MKGMKKLIIFLVIFVATLCSFSSCFATDGLDGTYITPCFDLEFIFARGSGGVQYYTKEFQALRTTTKRITEDYLLSSLTWDLDYPAVATDNIGRILGAFVSAGKAYEFGDSVKTGVENLKAHYRTQRENCPDMKYVLVGYSQGAMVVAQALSGFNSNDVMFVMLLGDPNTYLPEGKGVFPTACRGGESSTYRTFAPNCRTFQGVFGARVPYEVSGFKGKFSLWCNRDDYICGSSKNPFKNGGHTGYTDHIDWGMSYLARKYLKRYVPTEKPALRSAAKSAATDPYADSAIVDDGGGANITAPDTVKVWRDGDVLRLKWQVAPEGSANLLLRLNGVDLGYVDASLGEFEIRDIDFSSDYELDLAWMNSDGELGEVRQESSKVVPDSEPEAKPETPTAPSEEPAEPSKTESSEQASSGEEVTQKKNKTSGAIIGDLTQSNPPDALSDQIVPALPQSSGVAAYPSKKKETSGLSFASKSSIVNIVIGMFGASGLLLLFVLKRRRGA